MVNGKGKGKGFHNDLVSIQRGAPAVAVQGRAAGREATVHIETANNEQASDSVSFVTLLQGAFVQQLLTVLISPERFKLRRIPAPNYFQINRSLC